MSDDIFDVLCLDNDDRRYIEEQKAAIDVRDTGGVPMTSKDLKQLQEEMADLLNWSEDVQRLKREAKREQWFAVDARNRCIRDNNEKLLADAGDGQPIRIIAQFGTWAVTEYGLEHISGNHYHITSGICVDETLDKWLRHIQEQTWADVDDFAQAFIVAKQIHTYLTAVCDDGRCTSDGDPS